MLTMHCIDTDKKQKSIYTSTMENHHGSAPLQNGPPKRPGMLGVLTHFLAARYRHGGRQANMSDCLADNVNTRIIIVDGKRHTHTSASTRQSADNTQSNRLDYLTHVFAREMSTAQMSTPLRIRRYCPNCIPLFHTARSGTGQICASYTRTACVCQQS